MSTPIVGGVCYAHNYASVTPTVKMAVSGATKLTKPSKAVKERVAYIVEQDINELGKVAQYIRKRSQSKEVL